MKDLITSSNINEFLYSVFLRKIDYGSTQRLTFLSGSKSNLADTIFSHIPSCSEIILAEPIKYSPKTFGRAWAYVDSESLTVDEIKEANEAIRKILPIGIWLEVFADGYTLRQIKDFLRIDMIYGLGKTSP